MVSPWQESIKGASDTLKGCYLGVIELPPADKKDPIEQSR